MALTTRVDAWDPELPPLLMMSGIKKSCLLLFLPPQLQYPGSYRDASLTSEENK
jgi:hypothetical protein